MKRYTALFIALLLPLLLAGGCTNGTAVVTPAPLPVEGSAAPVQTNAPDATIPPVQGEVWAAFEVRQETLYYPEGSSEADAEYVLDSSFPYFTSGEEAAARMNEAVELYRAELSERVTEERLPFADRGEGEEAPSTVVTFEAELAGGYLNVRFYEEANYGQSAEHALYALVLDRSGEETSLAAVTGVFDPSALAAQQVLNRIAQDETMYFGDVTAATAGMALDLFNGFSITDTGYVLYAAEGTLAKPELGILSFPVEKSAFYPDFVGETVPAERFDALQNGVNLLARACAADYTSFSGGSPDALCASGFLSGLLYEQGVSAMERQAYESLFASYFTGVFPSNLAAEGDGTALEGDTYTIAPAPMATYLVELADARAENGMLILAGSLIYGVPGSSDAAVLAPVEIVLTEAADAPMGYKFDSFSIY